MKGSVLGASMSNIKRKHVAHNSSGQQFTTIGFGAEYVCLFCAHVLVHYTVGGQSERPGCRASHLAGVSYEGGAASIHAKC